MDARRRQWLPLSVRWAQGDTGTRIRERFGLEGLAVWAAFLAACKANHVQGGIEYASEVEGWRVLFDTSHLDVSFTLAEFFTFTGSALHQTRRPRHLQHGSVSVVQCVHWQEWNDRASRDMHADRLRADRLRTGCGPAAKRKQIGSENPRKSAPNTPPVSAPESEREIVRSSEETKNAHAPRSSTKKERPPDPLWDALDPVYGQVTNDGERGRRNKALELIRQSLNGAETEEAADEVRRRSYVAVALYPLGKEMALAMHWAECGEVTLS